MCTRTCHILPKTIMNLYSCLVLAFLCAVTYSATLARDKRAVSPCNPNPCRYGGKCSGVSKPSCTCPSTYSGEFCQFGPYPIDRARGGRRRAPARRRMRPRSRRRDSSEEQYRRGSSSSSSFGSSSSNSGSSSSNSNNNNYNNPPPMMPPIWFGSKMKKSKYFPYMFGGYPGYNGYGGYGGYGGGYGGFIPYGSKKSKWMPMPIYNPAPQNNRNRGGSSSNSS